MARITKKQLEERISVLEKENADLKKNITMQQRTIDILTERLKWYEKLPENACNAITGCIDYYTKIIFNQNKEAPKQ